MGILSLRIADFRNLASVGIEPCQQGLNLFWGNNGCGKTSLLEAIHYLGVGRSFRSGNATSLIRQSTNKFLLFAQLVSESQACLPVGVERHLNGTTRLRVAEKDVSGITEVASFLPIRVINAHSHQLFEAGPAFRRKYLDWGLFYQEEAFFTCWRQFERVLKQRNAVLRDKRPSRELAVWTAELVKIGLVLDAYRRAYVETISPFIVEIAALLLPIKNLTFQYGAGWDETMDFEQALAQQFQLECRSGHTQIGPHRADLDVQIEGVPAKHILSRGQQKLLVCAMILAQGVLLTQQANRGLIYLVDDLPAELDLVGRKRLMSLLAKQGSQVFITAIDSEIVDEFHRDEPNVPIKLFHVEHGSVTNPAPVSGY
ncbi:MAG: hypothetical protein A3E85_05540 [Gammaproteobacteria bacterium RIFCSPHIGHO2_12_FULL_45_12]|nr:MAG: hypothetical protein A3E85_05540 [Gammaproteobacteria bacterium RIFCSPHIGHO2_12_FULL_45_12]